MTANPINLSQLGVEKIAPLSKGNKLNIKELVQKERQELLTKSRQNFINSAVCVEYGLEHLEVALIKDFKSDELNEIRQDFEALRKDYFELRKKLNKFIKIEDMEDQLFYVKDMFQMCLDEITNGRVKFVDDKEFEKIQKASEPKVRKKRETKPKSI